MDLAGAAADVVLEQALGLEAEGGEHRHRRLLLGDDLDDELGHAQLDGLDDGPLGEQATEAAAPVRRVDDQAQLADVAAPRHAADDRHVPGDLAVDDGDQAVLVGVGHPPLDDAGLEDVLTEERAVALGDAGEEAPHGIGVAGLDGPDLDLRAAVVRRPSRAAPRGVPASRPSPGCCGAGPCARRRDRRARPAGAAPRRRSDPTSAGQHIGRLRRHDVVLLPDDVEERHGDVGEVDGAPAERHAAGRQQVLAGEQLAGLDERRARERDVVARPLRHHLVGGDEVVVPEVLPQVDVAGDVGERLEHAERVEHHVGRARCRWRRGDRRARRGPPASSSSSGPCGGSRPASP